MRLFVLLGRRITDALATNCVLTLFVFGNYNLPIMVPKTLLMTVVAQAVPGLARPRLSRLAANDAPQATKTTTTTTRATTTATTTATPSLLAQAAIGPTPTAMVLRPVVRPVPLVARPGLPSFPIATAARVPTVPLPKVPTPTPVVLLRPSPTAIPALVH